MKKTLSGTALAALLILAPTAAWASTMPKADFGSRPTLGIGLGNGVGVSIDAPISSVLSLGIGANLTAFSAASVDGRLLFKLLRSGPLTLDLLAGVEAGGPGRIIFQNFSPFAGVALAYPFTRELTGRLNLAADFLNIGSPDAAGIELGYKFSSNMEGTLGANGRGDFLGLKLSI